MKERDESDVRKQLTLDSSGIDFNKGGGLMPAILQDFRTGRVLMLGYMNADALEHTCSSGLMTFYSRSRERLWTKGETSGNTMLVREIHPDCDGDALLVKVEPTGPVCHTGRDTCFGERSSHGFLYELQAVIAGRDRNRDSGSYTSSLLEGGTGAVARKVGEEAVELVIAALEESDERFLSEAADLLYHVQVLLQKRGYGIEDVERVLHARNRKRD